RLSLSSIIECSISRNLAASAKCDSQTSRAALPSRSALDSCCVRISAQYATSLSLITIEHSCHGTPLTGTQSSEIITGYRPSSITSNNRYVTGDQPRGHRTNLLNKISSTYSCFSL